MPARIQGTEPARIRRSRNRPTARERARSQADLLLLDEMYEEYELPPNATAEDLQILIDHLARDADEHVNRYLPERDEIRKRR